MVKIPCSYHLKRILFCVIGVIKQCFTYLLDINTMILQKIDLYSYDNLDAFVMIRRHMTNIKSLPTKIGESMNTKKLFAVILTVVMVMSFATVASAADFTDVPDNHPYKVAIDFCQTNGFVKGTSSTTFMPDSKLTRAQFATIWCRTLNDKDDNHGFTDITKLKNYYDSPAIVLRSLGIFNGTSTTKFSPNDFVTREQLALLTMRTHKLGVADEDAYKQYADFASISEWARDGISSCINAEVFEGLYDGQNFKPGEPVTRAEICKLIYNLSVPDYTVTIGTLVGGTITASPTKARPGTLITLTITPDTGKQLKAGTLKYDDVAITGTTFAMPAKDVTITAEFEDKPVLDSIAVTSPPAKSTYIVGQALDLSGLVVTATYSDSSSTAVTGYTTTPAGGSTLDTAGTVTVTVGYTEGTIIKTTTFDVQVNAA